MKPSRLHGVLLIAMLLPLITQAQLTYTNNGNNTLTITGYSGTIPGSLVIPATINELPVTAVADFAFQSISGPTNLVIADSVQTIGLAAFYYSGLVSLTIGSGVTNIGLLAFAFNQFQTITVDAANPAYSSLDNALFNKNQTTLIQYPSGLTGDYTVPASVTSISVDAFAEGSLTSLTIGSGVTNIGEGAFFVNELNSISVSAANPAYSSLNGVLFNKSQTMLIAYPFGISGPYNIPATVTTIADYAFFYDYNITAVTIPNGVTSIGYDAFEECGHLTEITIPNSVTNINEYAFYDTDLQRATIGAGVTSIGYAAFDECLGLQSLFFLGNAPALDPNGVFDNVPGPVHYRFGTEGWGAMVESLSTLPYLPVNVVTVVAAGLYHSLFLTIDGNLWSMGENGSGQLGNGTNTSANRPQLVATNVMAIAGGGFHTLFVKNDGSLWAMGDNQYGELGDGTLNSTNLPEMIVPSNVVAVAAGVYHSLFLKSDSSLWGMGYNHDGQLGDGSFGPSNRSMQPEYLDTNVQAVAAGNYHSLYLKNGGLWAMGYNDDGQLGYGNYSSIYSHTLILEGATAIAARGNHSLYLDTNYDLFATGDNSSGEFGDGTDTSANSFGQTTAGFFKMAAGSNHSLLLDVYGVLYGTGANNAGQLGDGTYTSTNSLEELAAIGVIDMAAGDQHSLFLESDGSLWAMGNNSGGELGDGTFNNTNRPEQIVGPPIANGGFEMGNFDGWALTAGDSDTIISGGHSGTYAAQFHELYLGGFGGSTESFLSQNVTTVPGAKYLLSFWVNGVASGAIQVSWNGGVLTTTTVPSGWTNLQFVVTATGTNTQLQFTFAGLLSHATSTTQLDDVSVTMLPPSLTIEQIAGNNARFSFVGYTNSSYALERTFNLTPPANWVPQSTNATDSFGSFVLTNSEVINNNNFWRARYVP